MSSIWDASFVVVDVETTGAHPENNRITDIACITMQNAEIISSYNSLVNPHQFIPPFIVNMTGITNEMAFKAPEPELVFEQVYKRLYTGNSIFVAHNVRFDWLFVYHSLLREGYNPSELPLLCTLKLARRLLPKTLKKNVGSLANYFDIKIKNRHRAYGDAEATAFVLNELFDLAESEHGIDTLEELLQFQNKLIKNFKPVPAALKRVEEKLAILPESPGVYYYLGKKNEVLYVGKAKVLKDRVKSYFSLGELPSKKISDLVKKIYDIHWVTTDTELEALLLESKEIKKHKPEFNTVDKRFRRYPFIKIDNSSEYPIITVTRQLDETDSEYFGPFRSITTVNEILETIDKKFKVRKCEKDIKSNDSKPCFYYHIDRCIAPCSEFGSKEDYLAELEKVRYFLGAYSDGLIKQLETKMQNLSDNFNFESAALVRNQIAELRKILHRNQNVATSVNNNNLMVLIPCEDKAKTTDIYFIKSGKFISYYNIAWKTKRKDFYKQIHEVYFNGAIQTSAYSIEDIDELRIVTQWIYRQQKNNAEFLYTEGISEDELLRKFDLIIKGFYPEESEKDYFLDAFSDNNFEI